MLNKKHILYITQYYHTGEDVGHQRSHKNVEFLLRQGYKVTLITTYVNMMTTEVPEKYKKHDGKRVSKEVICDNFTIYFVNSARNFNKTFWSRANSFLSFSINSFIAGLQVKDIDLVIASCPPTFAGNFAHTIAVLNRAKFLYEVRDLWPEVLFIGNNNPNKFIYWLLWFLDKHLCYWSDKIIALNQGIKKRLLLRKISDDKVLVIPNGTDLEKFNREDYADYYPKSIIRENDEEFILIYAGNHSILYALENVIKVAKLLQNDYPRIKFALVGEGYLKKELMGIAKIEGVKNLVFYPYQPSNDIPEILYSSNLCILASRYEEYMKLSLTNKLIDYMSSGRPVVLSHIESINNEIVEETKCGLIGPPEDIDKFAENIIWMYEHQEEAKEMGKRGREYIETYYDRQKIFQDYAKLIESTLNS